MSFSLTKYLKPAQLSIVGGVLGVVITGSTAQAQPVYKWQDAKGATHYTQTPPPASAKAAQKVEVRSRSDLQPTVAVSDSSVATPASKTSPSGSQPATTAQQKPRLKAEDCQVLKDTVDTLASGRRLYESDANGERAYITEEQRAERISTYTKNLKEGCS